MGGPGRAQLGLHTALHCSLSLPPPGLRCYKAQTALLDFGGTMDGSLRGRLLLGQSLKCRGRAPLHHPHCWHSGQVTPVPSGLPLPSPQLAPICSIRLTMLGSARGPESGPKRKGPCVCSCCFPFSSVPTAAWPPLQAPLWGTVAGHTGRSLAPPASVFLVGQPRPSRVLAASLSGLH